MPFLMMPEENLLFEYRYTKGLIFRKAHTFRLTSNRLADEFSEWGGNLSLMYMPLDNLDTMQDTKAGSRLLLILTGIFVVLAAGSFLGSLRNFSPPWVAGALALVAVVCLGIWWLTRRRIFLFTSSGGESMEFDANKLGGLTSRVELSESPDELLNMREAARQAYVFQDPRSAATTAPIRVQLTP